MAKRIITFGEIMLRLAPPNNLRLNQARSFEATYGGSEANVAVSLAYFGLPSVYITRLPDNDLGDGCIQALRQYGVGVDQIARGGERLGVYFLEVGASQRASKVIYDRLNSALATLEPGMLDWPQIFDGADWFHWSGITPAVSASAAAACLEAVQIATEMGLTISCDLNYRHKLWQWGRAPSEVMPQLVDHCDLIIGNNADKLLGVEFSQPQAAKPQTNFEAAQLQCQSIAGAFPHLKQIALTLRDSISASHNTLSAILWSNHKVYSSPTFELTPIVDRVGGGDAFMAGLIYGLSVYPDPGQALNFAVAAASLKHSIFGDFNLVTVAEVEALMSGSAGGDVSR